ncbi:lysophospholipid acyltransferase family protein [Hathewaya histolytica]|uniref:1-acyl-sn-glycerol-3-phosphate acyltransferase n=1 Tax=Hathewaya histolytica TaxID=1498 RepID=A0A4U9RN72_HATHI|nr:lysophospholipid acyltransferase family protein [Hathewaya histolytica]VTQ93459.1 putative 1-acyl-sn-glycerol-3-phosphate acyltransferase [Hathewaya histolytica]
MRTYILFLEFGIYMIGCFFKKIKHTSLKKKSKELSGEYLRKVVNGWSSFIIRKVPMKLDVKGIENIPEEACLFACNHQSLLDIPVMLNVIPRKVGFVAKKELKKSPMITYWMEQIKCVFIDRQNPREGIKAIISGSEYLKEGHSMLIFPEGTRSRSSNMNEFKKGSLKMAFKSGRPIVPVTLDGTYKSYEGNNNKLNGSEVKIIFHEPIYLNDMSKEEKDSIHLKVQDIIKSSI